MTVMKCKRCGCNIGRYSGKGRPKSYCQDCAYIVDERKRKACQKKEKLGTTDISSKMNKKKNGKPNFEREAIDLKKELKDLGLKK